MSEGGSSSSRIQLSGAHLGEVIAVGVTASLSLASTTCFLTYVLWQHAKHYAPLGLTKVSRRVSLNGLVQAHVSNTQSNQPQSSSLPPPPPPLHSQQNFQHQSSDHSIEGLSGGSRPPPPLTHLQTQFGTLFVNLVVADFLQALAFSLNWRWVHTRQAPGFGQLDSTCAAQGILINIGDVGSAFLSLSIACHTLSFLVLKRKPPDRLITAAICFIWLVNAALVAAGLAYGMTHPPAAFFFAWTRVWCFIGRSYINFRLWLHYLWLLICLAGIAGIYIIIHIYLMLHNRHTSLALGVAPNSATVAVARRMLLYPLFYSLVVLPLTCVRLRSMTGNLPPTSWQTFGGCCLSMSGTLNIILYVTTRNVVFRDRKDGSITGLAPVPPQPKRQLPVMFTRESVVHYESNIGPIEDEFSHSSETLHTDSETRKSSFKRSEDDHSPSPIRRLPKAAMTIDEQIAVARHTRRADPGLSISFEPPARPRRSSPLAVSSRHRRSRSDAQVMPGSPSHLNLPGLEDVL